LILGKVCQEFRNCNCKYERLLHSFFRVILTRVDFTRVIYYNTKEENYLPKKPIELERIIFDDGWLFKSQNGSHRQYIHPSKPGKVTIPFHTKTLPIKTEKTILKQAGLI